MAAARAVLQDVDPLEAIELELDEEEDGPVYGWLYDNKPLQVGVRARMHGLIHCFTQASVCSFSCSDRAGGQAGGGSGRAGLLGAELWLVRCRAQGGGAA